jgi:prepilin-type N-terminal cleavage/methylation domain-containing protein
MGSGPKAGPPCAGGSASPAAGRLRRRPPGRQMTSNFPYDDTVSEAPRSGSRWATCASTEGRGVARLGDQRGFTLLEIAIVMVIIGLLTGGGVSLMKVLTERKARTETLEYLQQGRTALVSFAVSRGRLPWADSDGDGVENSGVTQGGLPFLTLQMAPTDAYRRVLAYEFNPNLSANRFASCSALRAGLGVRPSVVDGDGAGAAFAVAAVLVSAGPMDADGSGDVLDALAAGPHQGNNATGTPNYLRHPPVAAFDDLATYLSGNELFGQLCEFLSLAVNNNSGATVHVRDVSRGSDLGSLANGFSGLYEIASGSRVELRSAAGGGGALVASSPPTPTVLAGRGATLNLP